MADDLWQAEHTGVPVEPLTKRHPDLEIDDAYAIQSLNIDRHEVVTMSQDKFRVAQNASQRIVNFVAKQFTQLFWHHGGIVSLGCSGDLRTPMQLALDKSCCEWNEVADSANEVNVRAI